MRFRYLTVLALGDCSVLENGNILFSRQFGASEITPDKKIVWNYDGPAGTEIHTTWPVDRDRVLVMQNGNPAVLIIVNKRSGQVEKSLTLPTRNPQGVHGQFRHVRMTPQGNFLVAHLDLGKVVEYDPDGKEIWSVAAPSAWAAVRLKNGNTLISGNQHGYVREVNRLGETVWEINKNDLPASRSTSCRKSRAWRMATPSSTTGREACRRKTGRRSCS